MDMDFYFAPYLEHEQYLVKGVCWLLSHWKGFHKNWVFSSCDEILASRKHNRNRAIFFSTAHTAGDEGLEKNCLFPNLNPLVFGTL